MLLALVPSILLLCGMLLSALLIPGQWVLIAIVGAFIGFAGSWGPSRASAPPRPPVCGTPGGTEFSPRTMLAISAALVAIAALMLWLILREEVLVRMRPALASMVVFISASPLGMAVFGLQCANEERSRKDAA